MRGQVGLQVAIQPSERPIYKGDLNLTWEERQETRGSTRKVNDT